MACLEPDCALVNMQQQTADDLCAICYVEELRAAPCIMLKCGHVYHYKCLLDKIQNAWAGLCALRVST